MQRKWLVALFLILLGVIALLVSRYRVDIELESLEENGVEYAIYADENRAIAYGVKLTRHYNVGEKISLKFTPRQRPAYPDILPLNFTIFSPGGNETVFTFWLEPRSDPFSTSSFPDLVVTELTILKVEKLKIINSSGLSFVGEVLESGNYTLVFTSPYTNETSPLRYLALLKITIEKTYPHAFMAPLGIGFIVMGTLVSWAIKKSQKRSVKLRIKRKSP